MKLLLVDDEAHVREMMRLSLEADGYEIDEAADGDRALEAFGDGRGYAAILLDQKMPGLDGLETMKRMLAVAPDARVIMVTAYASIELAVDAMRLGAAHFVRKPMTPETLRGAVAAALDAGPRPSGRRAGGARAADTPIERITLNGFRIEPTPRTGSEMPNEHAFLVTRFPDGASQTITVAIEPDAIARVARLTRRELPASGPFWQWQARRLLSGHLWTEGRLPQTGRLTLRDVPRDDLELAGAWAGE
ncbi:MAG TPA: response regulator [Vicinamibacterales bacterium]|nr:response regulator [Vicinamibacterales bacterium]